MSSSHDPPTAPASSTATTTATTTATATATATTTATTTIPQKGQLPKILRNRARDNPNAAPRFSLSSIVIHDDAPFRRRLAPLSPSSQPSSQFPSSQLPSSQFSSSQLPSSQLPSSQPSSPRDNTFVPIAPFAPFASTLPHNASERRFSRSTLDHHRSFAHVVGLATDSLASSQSSGPSSQQSLPALPAYPLASLVPVVPSSPRDRPTTPTLLLARRQTANLSLQPPSSASQSLASQSSSSSASAPQTSASQSSASLQSSASALPKTIARNSIAAIPEASAGLEDTQTSMDLAAKRLQVNVVDGDKKGTEETLDQQRSSMVDDKLSAASKAVTSASQTWDLHLEQICSWEFARFHHHSTEMMYTNLKFKDPTFEVEYLASLPAKMSRSLRMFLIVEILNLLAYLSDYIIYELPRIQFQQPTIPIAVSITICFLILYFMSSKGNPHFGFHLFTTISYAVTCGCMMYIHFIRGQRNIDPNLILLIFVHQIFVRGPYRVVSRYSAAILVSNIIVSCLHGISVEVLQNITITTIVGTVFISAHYYLERSDRRSFIMGRAVEFLRVQAANEKELTLAVLRNLYPEDIYNHMLTKAPHDYLYHGSHVTCLSIRIDALHTASETMSQDMFEQRLVSIFAALERAFGFMNIEKIGNFGSCFLGVAGLFDEDHVESAKRAFFLAKKISASEQLSRLGLRVNARIHTGYVYGTIIGTHKRFEVFGEAVDLVQQLHHIQPEISLLLTGETAVLVKGSCNYEANGVFASQQLFDLSSFDKPLNSNPTLSPRSVHSGDSSHAGDDQERSRSAQNISQGKITMYKEEEEGEHYKEMLEDMIREDDERFMKFEQRASNQTIIRIQLVGIVVVYFCWTAYELALMGEQAKAAADLVHSFLLRIAIFGSIGIALSTHHILDVMDTGLHNYSHWINTITLMHMLYGLFILCRFILLEAGVVIVHSDSHIWSFIFEGFVWVMFCGSCPLMDKKIFYSLTIPWASYMCYFFIRYRDYLGIDIAGAARYCILFDLMTIVGIVTGQDAKILVATKEIRTQMDQLQEGKELLESQDFIEKLLLSVLPARIYHRIRASNRGYAEKHNYAILVCVELPDLTFQTEAECKEAMVLNAKMYGFVDAQARAHGFEVVKSFGKKLMISGGIDDESFEALDQMLRFALEICTGLKDVFTEGTTNHPKVALHFGPICGALMGKFRISYDFWGETARLVVDMCAESSPGHVQISQPVAKKLTNSLIFHTRLEKKGNTDQIYVTLTEDVWSTYIRNLDWNPVIPVSITMEEGITELSNLSQ